MIVLILGGGDLGSGVALRLQRAGLQVIISELAQPLAVRRSVSFANAIYTNETSVEGVTARRVNDPTDTLKIMQVLSKGVIPVLVDPMSEAVKALHPTVVVDARMIKRRAELIKTPVKLIIGLGPGFVPGENCHVAIETQRGHTLGRVLWVGEPLADTGEPDAVADHRSERVLRAPSDGVLETYSEIGEIIQAGQTIAKVNGLAVVAPFDGLLRGLLYPGLPVQRGMKIGDLDPRKDSRYCKLVSDKALAIGGGVLEAVLTRVELRPHLWK
jgi:xanthine dehydrogenase accessory factor